MPAVLNFKVTETSKRTETSKELRLMLQITSACVCLPPRSMLPDVVDDFRLANPFSKGHEAIFYSFYVFFTKFAAGISLGVSTLCLE